MAASAERSSNGHPSYARVGIQVERDTGERPAKGTLRDWWRAAKAGAPAPAVATEPTPRPRRAAAPAPETEPPPIGGVADPEAITWACRMLGRTDRDDLVVLNVADVYLQRCQSESDTARAALTKQIGALLDQHRNEALEQGERTPKEWTLLLCGMPERIVEAFKLSPWLWHDPRVLEMVEKRSQVPEVTALGVLYQKTAPEGWAYYIPGEGK